MSVFLKGVQLHRFTTIYGEETLVLGRRRPRRRAPTREAAAVAAAPAPPTPPGGGGGGGGAGGEGPPSARHGSQLGLPLLWPPLAPLVSSRATLK